MKIRLTTLAGGALSLLVPAWLLVAPASAQQQQQQQSQPRGESRGGGEGRATPHSGQGPSSGGGGGATTRSGGDGGGQSSGGGSTGGYSGGSRMRDSDGGGRRDSGGGGGQAVPRNSGGGNGGGARSGGSNDGSSGTAAVSAPAERERGTRSTGRDGARSGERRDGEQDVPSYARPREGRPAVGTAVPRGSVPPATGGGGIFVPGGYYGPGYYGGYYGAGYGYYDPWGSYGGYGGYYGGYYDPWYGGYPAVYQPSADYAFDEGRLRLKIKPRNAEVYVDGYYAGVVDDFDGIFQRLHLESGPHRIEIRAIGYETLTFEVMINADRTTTYEREMRKLP